MSYRKNLFYFIKALVVLFFLLFSVSEGFSVINPENEETPFEAYINNGIEIANLLDQ